VSDARTAAQGGTPSVEERREPASIAKLITTAAALRAGIDVDAVVGSLTCTGPYRVGKGIVWCASPAGPLRNVEHAMAVSCNMAFAALAERVGRTALVSEYRRWGFDGSEGGFPGSAGRVVAPEGDLRQLADLGIGLEAADITPLHAARLGLLAATGRSVQPSLLEATSGPLGFRPAGTPPPPAEAVLDAATAAFLESTMLGVSVYGTAAGVAPMDYPVAMKTGTAAAWRMGYHVNYVGVAPVSDPDLAFCVRVTHAPSSPLASRAGREVLTTLLHGLAERRRLARRTATAAGTRG
jgi:peptidoglycan glycosyltransferase